MVLGRAGDFVRLFQWKSGYVGTAKERIEQQASDGPCVSKIHQAEDGGE